MQLFTTLSLSLFAALFATHSVRAEECTSAEARKTVYDLLQRFEDSNTISELHSNQTSHAGAQQDGNYVFLFTYVSENAGGAKKKVGYALIDSESCQLKDYIGTNVHAIDLNGNEI